MHYNELIQTLLSEIYQEEEKRNSSLRVNSIQATKLFMTDVKRLLFPVCFNVEFAVCDLNFMRKRYHASCQTKFVFPSNLSSHVCRYFSPSTAE